MSYASSQLWAELKRELSQHSALLHTTSTPSTSTPSTAPEGCGAATTSRSWQSDPVLPVPPALRPHPSQAAAHPGVQGGG